MPPERRTYKIWSYFIYWCISGMCISAYTTGSTLLAFGLTPQQAIGAIVVGSLFVGLLSVACGWMGERHHIGFSVACRFTWGMRGSYFPIIVSTFTAIFWDGLQAYWGGQATTVTLGAIIPGLAHMESTLAGGVLMTKDLIGMLIFYIFFLTIMRIPPERLQRPFIISSIIFSGTLIGLLAWAVSTVHGGGPIWKQPGQPINSNVGWSMMFGITSILGAWGSGALCQSDWTRYANRPLAPTLSQMFAAPLTIIVTSTIGIVVTSCSSQMVGEVIWNPIVLVGRLQEFYGNSPRVRAAVFFAGLGCTCAQLGISIVLNSISGSMDMATLNPKYLNIRRGAYILALAGFASNPWQYLANASIFLTVLSGWGVFLSPFVGIMLADYHVIRRYKLKMQDLYVGGERSIYWYWHGFHWRPLVAWVIAVFPTLPGLIMSVRDATLDNNWVKLFRLTFFLGWAISFVTYILICKVFPTPGLGEGDDRHNDSMTFGLRDDEMDASSTTGSDDKTDMFDKERV
ncbi:hypothetical protein E1B28_011990 [Marasmius oreades]|uniref:Uncharacterized protein n=1 Tax=Marasmius oreades TaxID=181124 RepID=A0A9P7UPG2_9AGAR|nr:uncharacterized protein E1B28_011990 [Marasmius oreades]KAG7087946.1 hypothetical protein E1B28_011990 [Marasmius oreades]